MRTVLQRALSQAAAIPLLTSCAFQGQAPVRRAADAAIAPLERAPAQVMCSGVDDGVMWRPFGTATSADAHDASTTGVRRTGRRGGGA